MIIQQLSPERERTVRLKLYKDSVFLIAHEEVRPRLHDIGFVEFFVSAVNFAAYLVDNAIADEELMFYELEDVKGELKNHDDYYLFLAVVFIKLCSVAKHDAQAAGAARALVGFCQEYDGFNRLLKAMDSKEHKLRKEKRLKSLLEEELQALDPDKVDLEQAAGVMSVFVDNSMGLTAHTLEGMLGSLMATNEQYGHAFDADVDRLRQTLFLKTTPQPNRVTIKELVVEKNVEYEIGNVEAGAVGVQHGNSN